jgi:parallel beta-helix repeat protein
VETTFPLPILCGLLCLVSVASAADFIVSNANVNGPGSLAQAIIEANGSPGADRVIFTIPGSGLHTISVNGNVLPPITDALTIDGYTQPGTSVNTLATGSNAVLLIQIDGGSNALTPSAVGISIEAADCTIRGLIITGFLSTGSGGFGIESIGDRCVIEGNFIGFGGPSSGAFQQAGIRISGMDYRVGGTFVAARNMIGTNRIGIWAGSSQRGAIVGNQIQGNANGIVLAGTFTETVIGGSQAGAGNVIANNGSDGIRTGYTPAGSQQTEVATGVIVQGNLIGASSQSGGVSNHIGIELFGSGHVIGGPAPGAGNLIGANGTGIIMSATNASKPSASSIQGNEIAWNIEGGIFVTGSDHQIGGLAPGAGNHIQSNHFGIAIFGAQSIRNRILSNLIEKNGTSTGIDLGGDGPIPNDFGDSDTGPNNLQNFPDVTSFQAAGGNTVVKGELHSRPSTTFTLQFFGDLEGVQEQKLLNTQIVTTDADGSATWQFSYPGKIGLLSLTGTATDADGNTSETRPMSPPVRFANLSTRSVVGTGDNAMIGGFIIRSDTAKKMIIRALGPSLNVPERLADPYLEFYDAGGALLASNNDWKLGQQQEVMDSGIPPTNDRESAIVASLPEGNYTARVRGANGETGIGIVEVYELGDFPADAGLLVNISTRGFVGRDDNVLIGGIIIPGFNTLKIIVRAIGPDLAGFGVPGALQDPVLELHNQNGGLVASNDNWREGGQEQEIQSTNIPPGDERDSAIVAFPSPGNYTAIVRGKDGATGLALVEFYDLQR